MDTPWDGYPFECELCLKCVCVCGQVSDVGRKEAGVEEALLVVFRHMLRMTIMHILQDIATYRFEHIGFDGRSSGAHHCHYFCAGCTAEGYDAAAAVVGLFNAFLFLSSSLLILMRKDIETSIWHNSGAKASSVLSPLEP